MMQQAVQHPASDLHMFSSGILPERIEQLERIMIAQALKESKGNITKASEQLGIPRQNLNYKLKKYKIDYLKQNASSNLM